MVKINKTIIPIIIFLLIGFFLWKGLHNDPHFIPSPLLNKSVPDFTATNLLTGQALKQEIFRGHISILNVFASWCLYCLAEHAVIMDIARQSKVNVYGLNYKDTREEAEKWLKNYGNPFAAVIFDPTGHIAVNFGVYGTPETFLIDAQGVIRFKYVGPISHYVWRHTVYPKLQQLRREQRA